MYKCTDEYSPAEDRGIFWNDPDINIAWPLSNPVLSGKDRVHPPLRDADNNFTFNHTS
jgi:dTDP-4-dehydrorhamnose 3,5-epimerase